MATDPEDHADDDDSPDAEAEAPPAAKPAAPAAAEAGAVAPKAGAGAPKAGAVAAKAGEAPRKKKRKKAKVEAAPEAAPPAPAAAEARPAKWMWPVVAVLVAAGVTGIVLWRRSHAAPAGWSVGDEVDVELTLVAADAKGLSCAASVEIAGKHCGFEDKTKPWPAAAGAPATAGATDDKSLLRPYTTTDHQNLLAAGPWSEPAFAPPLPATRFTAKCKYKVEGKMPKPSVRWGTTAPWNDVTTEWRVGTLSDCSVDKAPPPAPKPSAH